jgi:thiamine biosynthesis lipoprotein
MTSPTVPVSSPAPDPTAAEPPAPRAARTRGPHRVVRVMGTVISIDVRDPHIGASVVDRVVAHLVDIDRRFSTYLAASEVSRLGRGEIDLDDASPDLRYVLTQCERLRVDSDGAFDVWAHRADGGLDPSGFVKGWAVEEAVQPLLAAGARDWAINAGGDVIAHGNATPGQGWKVGIRHPDRSDRVAAVLTVRDLAVATSGAYERCGHIRDPRARAAATGLASVTVVGPSLAMADAFATAAFAMGGDGPGWVTGHPGYGVYAITDDGRVRWSPDLDRLLA